MSASIGVVIASIPPRAAILAEALTSVCAQTRLPESVTVGIDSQREGTSTIRNRAWRGLTTDWIAFLDDDDLFYPEHLEVLERHAIETGADLVYPWFDVRWRPGQVPFDFLFIKGETAEGHPFDDDARWTIEHENNFIPITVLVRRELLEAVDGFPIPQVGSANEDWGCWKRMLAAGGRFSHFPQRTWMWRWHYSHTMGMPDRW